MPASRTKSTKRSNTGNQLVWTNVKSSARVDVSFTVNLSPVTYSDSPPPLVEYPPSEFIMFPPPGEITPPRRQTHSKKKPENHIPRPPNAFILFRSSFIKSQHVSTEVETNHSTLSKIIGLTWSNMPEEERQVWHLKAKEALDEHKRKFPKYAFRPVQTKAKGAPSEKRKVREVEPKDIKRCAKIAELLVEGKKGNELNAAIQEFDKTHVPEIITRFEAPITARAYRRSSSAPIPDTENSRASQSFFQQLSTFSPKKVRSSSTRPSTPEFAVDTFNLESPAPTVGIPSLPLKEEATFSFGEFSFDNVASPLPMFECDPMSPFTQGDSFVDNDSFADHHFDVGLTIDTSFDNSWPSSPCPQTPDSPYMSPMSAPSPISPYPGNFDNFENFFDAQFPSYEQTCGLPQQETMMCGGGGDHTLYGAYNESYLDPHLSSIDLSFSNFMEPVHQYV